MVTLTKVPRLVTERDRIQPETDSMGVNALSFYMGLSRFSHVWLCDPKDSSPPGSSVHGLLQARILEWVAMPFSRGSPQPRIKPVSLTSPALTGGFFTTSATSTPVVSKLLPYRARKYIFKISGSPSLYCDSSSLPLKHRNNHGQYGNWWMWLFQ